MSFKINESKRKVITLPELKENCFYYIIGSDWGNVIYEPVSILSDIVLCLVHTKTALKPNVMRFKFSDYNEFAEVDEIMNITYDYTNEK